MENLPGNELQRELNNTLIEAQKRSLNLWGLIRKIPSVNSVVLKQRDEAKEDLQSYVGKLSENLLQFSSEVLESIDRVLKEKQEELNTLKGQYEAEVDVLVRLCTEAESLLQFGRHLNDTADRDQAVRIMEEMRSYLLRPVTECRTKNLFNITIKKTLEPDDISPKIFGHLITSKPEDNVSKTNTLQQDSDNQSMFEDENSQLRDEVTQTVNLIDEFVQTETLQQARCGTSSTQNSQCSLTKTSNTLQVTPPPGFNKAINPQTTQVDAQLTHPNAQSTQLNAQNAQINAQSTQLNAQNAQINAQITQLNAQNNYANAASTMNATNTLNAANVYQNTHNAYLNALNAYPATQNAGVVCMTGGIPGYIVTPVNEVLQSTGAGTLDDPILLCYGNVMSNVNQNMMTAGQGMATQAVNMLAASNCTPMVPAQSGHGFSTIQHRSDINSDISTANTSTVTSQYTQGPTSKTHQAHHTDCKVSEEPSSQDGSTSSNITDRNSVYLPPKLPKFVKDLEKQFETPGACKRKPLRRPFRAPPGLTHDHTDIYHHSTPVRDIKHGKSDLPSLQDIGRELMDTSLDSTNSVTMISDSESSGTTKTESDNTNTAPEDYCEINKIDVGVQMTLRDYVKKNYPMSVREKNRQVLQSQTNWCKGYLSRTLASDTRDTHTANTAGHGDTDDKKNVIVIDDPTDKKTESWDTHFVDATGGYHIDLTKPKDIPCSPFENQSSKMATKNEIDLIKTEHIPDSPFEYKSCKMTTKDETESISDNSRVNTSKDDSGIYVTDKREADSPWNEKTTVLTNTSRTRESSWDKPCKKEPKLEIKDEPDLEIIDDDKMDGKKVDKYKHRPQIMYINKTLRQKQGSSKPSSDRSRTLGPLQAHWLTYQPSPQDLGAKWCFEVLHSFHYPIGVTSDLEGNIIVTDTGNHVVKKFNQSGEFLCEFGKELSMKRPSAVVVNEHGDIFVKDDVCIRKFDQTGSHVLDIKKSKLKKPFGLAMTPAKLLLVLETHHTNPTLIHISQDGEKSTEYIYSPLINCPPQSKCRFMGVSDNSVIVSDLGLSQIYITNLEGVFLKIFGGYGAEPTMFWEPSGISVDKYGNVLIADSKHNRIQMFRYDGSYTGLLSLDVPIVRPSGIHFTADNKLLVVNFLDHLIKVYKFD